MLKKTSTEITGNIKKDQLCEFEQKCTIAGVRCMRDSSVNFHCGYCKSFRMIQSQKENED